MISVQGNSSISLKVVSVTLLLIISVALALPVSAGFETKYSKLLDNCVVALDESGFTEADKKLTRKIQSGTRYKFWIDVVTQDQGEATTYRAYCEGKYRKAEIEVFAFGQGEWRPQLWSLDTEEVIKTYVAKQ